MKETIFGLVLFGLFAGGVYYYYLTTQPVNFSPRDTSSLTWQNYANKKFGIAFSYPKDFTIHEREISQDSYLEIGVDSPSGQRYLFITAYGNKSPISKNILNYFVGPYPKIIQASGNIPQQTIIQKWLNGLKGVELYGLGAEGHSYTDIFLYQGTKSLWQVYLNPIFEGKTSASPNTSTLNNINYYKHILSSVSISD